jgi:regulator of protease activity HflC (stomatin/prohibitin superfamily)
MKTRTKRWIAVVGAGIVVLFVVAGIVAAVSGPTLTKADGGTVIVVRNGGWLDDNSYRDTVQPNSSLTWEGWHSQEHPYPASQRYFTVSATEGADSNEVINVPTQDGVNTGIEGTFYFQLSTDPKVLQDFDDKFGTRTFPNSKGEQVNAWDSEGEGWSAFLNATIGNVVKSALRTEIGKVRCQDLQASCALAFNATAVVDGGADVGNSTLAAIQDNVNKSFTEDVERYLGGAYFTNIQFVLSKPTLPQNIQDAINASFARVADQAGKTQEAQGKVTQAQSDATANAARQQGYDACKTCAAIDQLNALPDGLLTYAPGGQFAIAPAPAG